MYCTNLFRTYKGLDLYDFGRISRAISFSPFCSSSGRQCNDIRYCAVALLCCQASCQAPGAIFRAGTCIIKGSILRNITISLDETERKIATCFDECYVSIFLGNWYNIVLVCGIRYDLSRNILSFLRTWQLPHSNLEKKENEWWQCVSGRGSTLIRWVAEKVATLHRVQ